MKLKVLVACESSGVVRDAFSALGHDAMSCDLKPSDTPGNHYKGDIRDILSEKFDLLIGHPPCTRLTNSVWWYIIKYGLYTEVKEACDFFLLLWRAPIKHICLENPVQNKEAKKYLPHQSQMIQPYNFGADASKATCLWLKNLPLLQETKFFPPRLVNGRPRWENQTDGGYNRLGPDSKHNPGNRATLRSKTYPGIATAMASQYTHYINSELSLNL